MRASMRISRLALALALAAAGAGAQEAIARDVAAEKGPKGEPAVTSLQARCLPSACLPVEVYQRAVATQAFLVGNTGPSPVSIAQVASLTGDGTARFDPVVLAPGAETRVTVEQPVGDTLGLQTVHFDVISPDTGRLRLSFPVFVQSAYAPERPQVDLGYVRRSEASPKLVGISSYQAAPLSVLEIVQKPYWLSVMVVPRAPGADVQSAELRTVLLPSAPLGELSGHVLVKTNVADQPLLAVGVRAHVYGDVNAMPATISFGAVKQGEPAVQEITLRAVDGKPLSITRVAQVGEDLAFSSKPCGEGCVHLRMDLDTAQARLISKRAATVWFEGREESVELPFSGLVVGPDTNVHSLGVVTGEEDIKVDGEKKGGQP